MNRGYKSSSKRLLNVGCGARFDSEWQNIDLVPYDPTVIAHDIRQGLPFTDGSFDAIYHSHVLEHLTPEQGELLLRECHRLLSPGGILRIVVPDLEGIARLYLQMLERAWNGDRKAAENYNWMKLELLDQLVRQSSGGRMGPYMTDPNIQNTEFVRSRIGNEFLTCQPEYQASEAARLMPLKTRIVKKLLAFRLKLAKSVVRFAFGKECCQAFTEGMFRRQGEIHRWMYDRYSLERVCRQVGFGDFRVCDAHDSRIDGFADYSLDTIGETIRKPDSLYVECRKATETNRAAA